MAKRKRTYYEDRRDKEVEGFGNIFDQFTDIFNRILWSEVFQVINLLEVDDQGRFQFNTRNLTRSRQAGVRVVGIFQQQKKTLAGRIIDRVKKLLGFNKEYFGSFNDFDAKTVEHTVESLVMGRLGYNTQTGSVAPGSWLDSVFNGSQVAGLVGRDLTNAISSKMSRADFIKQLRPQFLASGYASAHFRTFSFDFFQVVDRQIKLLYAEELGLNFARYAGTAMERTRPFCLERLNNVYTLEEIKKWADLEFRGKLKVGYDPFIHCGGFNCRHHLAFLDETAVDLMGAEVNKYNTIILG